MIVNLFYQWKYNCRELIDEIGFEGFKEWSWLAVRYQADQAVEEGEAGRKFVLVWC